MRELRDCMANWDSGVSHLIAGDCMRVHLRRPPYVAVLRVLLSCVMEPESPERAETRITASRDIPSKTKFS